jgi:hypothetical protein
MQDYLTWEVDLLQRIERDGSCSFHPLARQYCLVGVNTSVSLSGVEAI